MNRSTRKRRNPFVAVALSLFEEHGTSRLQKAIFSCTAIALYLFGLLRWARFSNFGKMTFDAGDWYKERAFYTIIQQSLADGTIPYHISLSFHGTDRFLAIPETVLSPQILILSFTQNLGVFFLCHILILFTVGFFGCLAIQRHFSLSSFSFCLFTGLFTLNGYITSHLAVGHVMWGGYFFLPWFFLILIKMSERENSTSAGALDLAIVLFLIMMQGSLHLFVQCLLYLALFAVFRPRHLRVIASAIFVTGILNFYRLFPAVISFREHDLYFQSGYPTIRDMFDAFTMIKYPSIDMIGGLTGALYWWDLDVFVGVIGLMFIFYFGIYRAFATENIGPRFADFDLPNFAMAIFATSHFFSWIGNLPIPLASVERVPSRFLIFPVVALLIFSSVRLDRTFRKWPGIRAFHFLAICGLIQTYFELVTHMRYWNIQSINSTLPAILPLNVAVISMPSDEFYIASVKASVLVSVVGLTVWAVLRLMVRHQGTDH